MTTELNIWPWEAWETYKSVFREAKQGSPRLASTLLQPKPAKPGCGRLLAFGGNPPFAGEYLVIRKRPEDLEKDVVLHILMWYVGLEGEPRETTMADWLSLTLGRKAVEVG